MTIEGLDGAGKTTLAGELARALAGRGITAEVMREPGGVACSERVRDLVKDPGLRVDPRTEALLYAAARSQLVSERLEPLLASGRWVLLDRFVDSSLAYQGAGRGLGLEPVRDINRFATAGLEPDRTLLLRIEPATGRERASSRGEAPDRLESEGDDFFVAIAAAYDELAAREPGRVVAIDAERPPDAVLEDALRALAGLGGLQATVA